MNTEVEFSQAVNRGPASTCWSWKKGVYKEGKRKGVGKLRWGALSAISAPQVAYQLAHQLAAPPANVNHTCGNDWCCNPLHIYSAEPVVAEVKEPARKVSSPYGERFVYLDYRDGWIGVQVEPKDQGRADAFKAAVPEEDRLYRGDLRRWVFRHEAFGRVIPVLRQYCSDMPVFFEPKHEELLRLALTGPVGNPGGRLGDILR